MKRRDFLQEIGKGATLGWVAGNELLRTTHAGESPAAAEKPNIILILADDLGYNDLGIQGCKDIPTPNIDSIGHNGVRLTQSYVSCPLCAPQHAPGS